MRKFLVVLLAATSVNGTVLAADPIEKIELQRTECYGTCPAYTVTIEQSGVVTFVGKDHVRRIGSATSTISASDWALLNEVIQRTDFFAFRAQYGTKADGCTTVGTDAPSMKITVARPSTQKSVWYYQGCYGPKALRAMALLGDTIDFIADTPQWTGRGDAP
jgi:hypothetical protein